MTAILCPAVPEQFSEAASRDRLFTFKERTENLNPNEAREQPKINVPGESCKTNLFFGFFFDGTKNNYELAEKPKSHSNVARLYDCYPGMSVPGVLPKETDWTANADRYTHFFRVYVPGVASPFKEVDDSGKGLDYTLGAAIGSRGEARIVWALVQAVNNVHRYFKKKPLLDGDETKKLIYKLDLNRDTLHAMRPKDWKDAFFKRKEKDLKTRAEFEKILERLHAAISPHWVDKLLNRPKKIDPGIVKTIHISIFGFSRGATQARAFANWLVALCKLDAELRGKGGTMTLGGFDVQFDFMGLFDTVASIGAANTFGDQWGVGFIDGHGEWADAEFSLRVPSSIPCLHLVAAHEVRRSFPLDSIAVKSVLPGNCSEIVVPGVHSDLGGGYSPTEQGKGTDPSGADMLSRIPLVYMYRAARLAGVPLKLELASASTKEKFRVAPVTIKAFNDYIAKCQVKSGSLTQVMREQRRHYMQWRLQRRVHGTSPLEKTASYLRATQFDKNDLHSANLEFEKEIAAFEKWLLSKGGSFRPKEQQAGFDEEHENEWEEIATWWRTPIKQAKEISQFFDDYVHDSRAWFKLVAGNADNEEDMHAELKEWVAKRRYAIAFNKRLEQQKTSASTAYANKSVPRRPISDGLTAEQRRAAEEYERTGKIPEMLTEGREPFDKRELGGLYMAAKAGYLRYRKVYGGGDGIVVSQSPSQGRVDPAVTA